MLFIVDGTGEFFDDNYTVEMAGSFCKILEIRGKGSYMRGPSVEGLMTFEKSKVVVRRVLAALQKNPKEPIYLAGHSRGGAAVIYAAQLLGRGNIPVQAMFLYDAVDRTLDFDIDVSKISGNVVICYHARRFPHLSDHFKKAVATALAELNLIKTREGEKSRSYLTKRAAFDQLRRKDLKVRQLSRCENILDSGFRSIDFGNCGTSADAPCRYEQKFFLGTHGAIGGAPALDHSIDELTTIDRAAMRAVDAWRGAALAKEGVLRPSA